MSWNISTGLVKKSELAWRLSELEIPETQQKREESLEQFNAAKMAGMMLAMTVPGPYVVLNFTGHANGVGWHKVGGMSNDFISVTISQQTEEDVKHFNKEVDKI